MRRATTTYAIGPMLWVAASAVQAVGFGRVSNTTSLGQPLNFEAVVRLSADETLTPECVFAEVFSGDNKLVQPLVRVQLDSGADGGERKVRVRTSSVIDEPVVTVVLTLGCDGSKTTRKFVAFIDPPAVGLAQSGAVGEPSAALSPTEAPATAAANGARPAADPGAASASPGAQAEPPLRVARPAARVVKRAKSTVVGTAQPRKTRSPAFGAQRPPTQQAGSRLQLEAAAPIRTAKAPAPAPAPVTAPPAAAPAVVSPPLAAASAALAAPAASSVLVAEAPKVATEPLVDPLASERARLKALEDSLTRVRDETMAAQKSLATLQLKVKEAESQRYANPLVYALAGVCALLALAVAGLWRRQVRARNEPKWWGTVAPGAAAVAASRLPEPEDDVPSQFAEVAEPVKPAARVIVAPEAAKQVWADSRQTEPAPDLVPEPRRDLSVEELIDLEQQAEFFVVLGQDDAAIDLLMGHVRSTGGISPLPYLKLLEIYRRRGDRSAYERIRERFNRRFNAYAPDWDADLQQGRSLEDYPATIARLEALWVMPSRVMETLEASLFRRDETEEAFDLPAYRELLFLYAVARDFAHKADDSSAVDLLLPMDTDAPSAPVSRLVASMPTMLASRGAAKREGDSQFDSQLPEEPDTGPKTDSGLSMDLGPLDLVDDPVKPGGIIRR